MISPSPSLRIFSIRFPGIPLWPRLIPRFRGGVIEQLGRQADLFHNHGEEEGSLLHRPALIQYRVQKGCAALFGMGEGARQLESWWMEAPDQLEFGGRIYPIHSAEVRREDARLQVTQQYRYYRVHDYLALNEANFQQWIREPRLGKRVELLESVLVGHLLGFCETAQWALQDHVQLDLVHLHKYRKTRYHRTELIAFELTYRCNLVLPEGIALGKAVSHGFGVQGGMERLNQSSVVNNQVAIQPFTGKEKK